MSKLDLNKPLRTVDTHRPARVICTDCKGAYGTPIIALVQGDDGSENPFTLTEEGLSFLGTPVIENVPGPNKFRNLYKEDIGFATDRYSLAEAQATANRGSTYGWVGTFEETPEGEFVAFHPRPKGD